MGSLTGASGRGLFTLYQCSYQGFKGIFVKIQALDHNPTYESKYQSWVSKTE